MFPVPHNVVGSVTMKRAAVSWNAPSLFPPLAAENSSVVQLNADARVTIRKYTNFNLVQSRDNGSQLFGIFIPYKVTRVGVYALNVPRNHFSFI